MANRMCVFFDGIGFVPTHSEETYTFETSVPKKVGDDSIIIVNGKRHFVRLLRTQGMVKSSLWLVEAGNMK